MAKKKSMDDLISRQAVLDLYKEYQPYLAVKVYEFGERLKALDPVPTIEAEPVTWYTAEENQPDSVGDDVLIVDHDGKYHVAYYCSKGNWIDTNTGDPIEVIKWSDSE